MDIYWTSPLTSKLICFLRSVISGNIIVTLRRKKGNFSSTSLFVRVTDLCFALSRALCTDMDRWHKRRRSFLNLLQLLSFAPCRSGLELSRLSVWLWPLRPQHQLARFRAAARPAACSEPDSTLYR